MTALSDRAVINAAKQAGTTPNSPLYRGFSVPGKEQGSETAAEVAALKAQNEALKTQLAQIRKRNAQVLGSRPLFVMFLLV